MANSQRDIKPLFDTEIFKKNRVVLVKDLVLTNVMSSVKPFLLYPQVDEINGGKTRGDKIRKLLDTLQLLVSAGQYRAFNAFLLALGGTQPDLFKIIIGRVPTISESDFCVKEVAQVMKTVIENTKHHTDSVLDEEINFHYEYVELSMLDRASENEALGSQRGKLPQEYSHHLDRVHSRDRNVSPVDILGRESKPYLKVSIYGRAGIGKSTTLQFLAKQWALGRWAAGFTMLFLLQLRFLTTQVIAISIVEVLQLYGLYDFPDHSDSTAFSSWLRNSGSKIIILIDGLDEIPGFAERMKNTPRIHDVLQKAHPIDLCINILRGDLLPGCTVISASRPFAGLSQLPADAKAEILGLTSEKVTEYVEYKHPNHVRNIMSVLSKTPILLSVCSITFYCMLITRLLSEGVTILDEDINTYTRLMSFVIVQYCSRKFTDSSFQMEVSPYFSKLAQLAHSGIFQLGDNEGLAKIVFDEDDLINSNLHQQDIDKMKKTGIIQVTRRKIGRHESWTAEFFHLSVQELLAVAHFLSHPPFPGHILHQLFHSGQFNLALHFIFGLYFDRTHSWIRQIYRAVSADAVIEGIGPELSSFIDGIVRRGERGLTSPEKLRVCQLIHEGQWEDKAKEVVSLIAPGGKLRIARTTVTAIELLAVAYICQTVSLTGIYTTGVHADDTFVDVLMSSLCEHHWETLQELNLRVNSIGYAGAEAIALSLCTHNHQTLQVLDLGYNRIGAAGAEALAQSLSAHHNQALQVLNLERNSIGDAGAAAIAASLCKADTGYVRIEPRIKTINITANKIGDPGMKALGRMLRSNDNLQELFAGSNEIGDEGLKVLAAGLHHNTGLKVLMLNRIHATGSWVEAFAEMLQCNTSLKVLSLGGSRLGDDGVKVLAAGLHRNTTLTELNLTNNNIGDKGAGSIAIMLRYNTSPDTLSISFNQIGDVGVQAIADSLVSNTILTKLNLSNQEDTGTRCLGNPGAIALAHMLHKNTSLFELDISDNNIGVAGAIAIASAFYQTAACKDLVHIPVVTKRNMDDDVEVRRWTWCGCLPSLYIEEDEYSTTLGAGVDPTRYNITLRKLDIGENRIGPASKKVLRDIKQCKPYMNIIV